MSNQHRVVWDEGMMLAPQHFQQWERWLEAELRDRSQATATYGWGFTSLEVDQGAMTGGEFAITNCSGFFPDGTAFACPTRTALPAARALMAALEDREGKDRDLKEKGLAVLLAVPKVVQGASSYADLSSADNNSRQQPAPMLRSRVRVVDTARPETDREIATAQLNLSIKVASDDLAAFHTMPIGRVVRAAGGGIEFASDSTPPTLHVRAASIATSVLRQTVGMLAQKWTELSGKRRGGGGMADASGLLLLHTAGDSLPGLRHSLEHGGVSTEAAYLQLARLAAQMCTFHESMTPSDVPTYVHADPGPAFHQLGEMLQELLGEAAPSMCDTLPLEREGESMYWARIPSPNMLSHGSLYLSVRADATEDEIQTKLPVLTKITAKDKLQDLLMRAIPGLPIRFTPQPPSAIPAQPGRCYFRLEPDGEHWDAIGASLTLAIHAAPGLQQLSLELLAVKQ